MQRTEGVLLKTKTHIGKVNSCGSLDILSVEGILRGYRGRLTMGGGGRLLGFLESKSLRFQGGCLRKKKKNTDLVLSQLGPSKQRQQNVKTWVTGKRTSLGRSKKIDISKLQMVGTPIPWPFTLTLSLSLSQSLGHGLAGATCSLKRVRQLTVTQTDSSPWLLGGQLAKCLRQMWSWPDAGWVGLRPVWNKGRKYSLQLASPTELSSLIWREQICLEQ